MKMYFFSFLTGGKSRSEDRIIDRLNQIELRLETRLSEIEAKQKRIVSLIESVRLMAQQSHDATQEAQLEAFRMERESSRAELKG